MKNCKLVVFDWDGTLMDSIGTVARSIQAAARRLQLPVHTEAKIRSYIGLNLFEQIEILYPETPVVDFVKIYREEIAGCYYQIPLYSGVRELLQYLQQQGYTLAVATSKCRTELEKFLDKLGLRETFATTRCGDDEYRKPHPQMLLGILDELYFSREEAVMVGDSTFDLELANNAGVAGIAVSYGSGKEEDLRACNPAYYVNNVEELKALF